VFETSGVSVKWGGGGKVSQEKGKQGINGKRLVRKCTCMRDVLEKGQGLGSGVLWGPRESTGDSVPGKTPVGGYKF